MAQPMTRAPAPSSVPARLRGGSTAEQVVRMLDDGKTDRRQWDRRWEPQRKYFGPDDARFDGRKVPQGQRDRRVTVDTYGVIAANRLAQYLYNNVVTPSSPFDLKIEGRKHDDLSRPQRKWLTDERDATYEEMTSLQSGFLVAFAGVCGEMKYGNAFMATFERVGDIPRSRHVPLGQLYIREDRNGDIDLYMWPQQIRARECRKDWGEAAGEKVAKLCESDKGREELVDVIHVCERNPDWNPAVQSIRTQKWHVGWVMVQDKCWAEEGWSRTPCYQEFRMPRTGGNLYAVGPADDCLEEIRMAQRARGSTIKSVEKHNDPPYMVADDGVVTMSTHEARGEIVVRAELMRDGNAPIRALPPTGNPTFGMELTREIHAIIDLHFFRRLIELPREPRMTVDQILGIQEEAARGTAPLVLPLLVGLSGVVMRYHDLRRRDGRVAPPPEGFEGTNLKVNFTSPLAKAAMLAGVNAFVRGSQLAKEVSQLDQRAVLVADWVRGLRDVLLGLGVDPGLLPDSDELKALLQGADEAANEKAALERTKDEAVATRQFAPAMQLVADLFKPGGTPEARAA